MTLNNKETGGTDNSDRPVIVEKSFEDQIKEILKGLRLKECEITRIESKKRGPEQYQVRVKNDDGHKVRMALIKSGLSFEPSASDYFTYFSVTITA